MQNKYRIIEHKALGEFDCFVIQKQVWETIPTAFSTKEQAMAQLNKLNQQEQ